MPTGPRRDLISRLMRESLELATTCRGNQVHVFGGIEELSCLWVKTYFVFQGDNGLPRRSYGSVQGPGQERHLESYIYPVNFEICRAFCND